MARYSLLLLFAVLSVPGCSHNAGLNHGTASLQSLALLSRADSLIAQRDWSGAVDAAKQAMEVDTSSFAAHYVAAVAYRESGAFANREAAFAGPSLFGDWKRSRDHFAWIFGRDSSYRDVLYQFALLLRYEGDRDGALRVDSVQIARRPELVGPQAGMYSLFRYFMGRQDSADFALWLGRLPGSVPRYFLAELFRRHGNIAAADSLLSILLYNPGDVSPQAVRLSLARVRSSQGDGGAAEAEYWRGVKEIRTPLGAALLFDDLKYIVSDGEIALYNGLDSLSQKRDFFRSFWNFRNSSLALGTNKRLQDHIWRFVEAEKKHEYFGARTQFNNPDRLRELNFPAAFSLNDEFNDMGLIFLRQGPPDDIIRHDFSPFDEDDTAEKPAGIKTGIGELSVEDQTRLKEKVQRARDNQHLFTYAHDSYESWLFDATVESPRMIIHFQKHNSVGNNWQLVPVPALDAMIHDLQAWDSRFNRMYEGLEDDRLPLQTQMKADTKGLVQIALSTEKETPLKKTETFQFPHQIDVFRAPDGRSLLDVSYAIPLASLARGLPDSVKSIPVEVGFSLVDAKSRHAATQKDTMQIGVRRSGTGAILDLIRYTVPPDSYAVAMHIRPLGADKFGTWRQTLRVRDFSQPGFMMSSLQLLRPSADKGALAIDGVKVVQSPLRTQSRTEPVYVYFQLYHLVPDAVGIRAYRTELVLVPYDEKDPAKGRVVYRGGRTWADEMAAVFCQVDVHGVDPGRYRLIVNATDLKRVETLTAEREIEFLR